MLAGKVRNASRSQHAAPLLPQYIWTRDFSQTSKHGRELVTGPVATHESYLPAGLAWDTVSQQSPGGWGVQESFASPMERDRLLAHTSSRRRLPTQLCLHFSRSDAGGASQARAEDGRRQHKARVGWPAAATVLCRAVPHPAQPQNTSVYQARVGTTKNLLLLNADLTALPDISTT